MTQERIHYDKEHNKYFCSVNCANLYACKTKIKEVTKEVKRKNSEDEKNLPSNQSQNNPTQELNNLKNKPNLNSSEQARIKELEKELAEKKQVEQKGNNYQLWLGIGCGALGLGLIGLVVYLATKPKK